MTLNVEKTFHELTQAGETWADCKAAYEALDDVTKTVLSDITLDHLPNCASKAEAETRALASDGFKNHLAAKSAARRAWLFAEVKWKNCNTLAELRRSEESTR